jgi:hypothetical protein
MTKPLNAKLSKEPIDESQKKLILAMTEILFILKDEMEKIEQTVESIKNNPKPDIEYMTLPVKLSCYKDGLKFAFKIITKYKQMESVINDGK